MADVHSELECAIREVTQARKAVGRSKSRQVTAADEIDQLKAVAYAWFQTHRPEIAAQSDGALLAAIDAPYKLILSSTSRAAARSTYLNALRDAKAALAGAVTELAVPAAGPV